MPAIAIVGTEGSGKTVLITALARRYAQLDENGIALSAANRKTASYVSRAWQAMQNREWPASTLPGELVPLKWFLSSRTGRSHEVRLVDSAGQDLRRLFADEQVESLASLPTELQKLAQYVREADIVLLLANLGEFVGEKDAEKRLSNEWTLRGALDYLTADKRPRTCAIVFTQVDRYSAALTQLGSWREIAHTYLPHIFDLYLAHEKVTLLAVSAVGATQTVADEQGVPRRVPDFVAGNSSTSLDELMQWLATKADSIKPPEGSPPQPAEQPEDVEPSPLSVESTTLVDTAIEWCLAGDRRTAWIWGAVIMLLLCGGCPLLMRRPQSGAAANSASSQATPKPVVVAARFIGGEDGWQFDTVKYELDVQNQGGSGNVRVYLDLKAQERFIDRKEMTYFMTAQSTHTVPFQFELRSHDYRQVTTVYFAEPAE